MNKYCKLEGQLKKKSTKGFGSFMNSYEPHYFAIRSEGQFFCYYEDSKKPVPSFFTENYDTKPKGIIFSKEIKEVVDNFEGNKETFLVKSNLDDMQIKIENAEDRQRWIDGLRSVAKFYREERESVCLDNRKTFKDSIDIKALNMILEDQESTSV